MKMNKKSNIIINILIVVVILGGASIFWYMQRTVPYWQCSDVYKRYKDVEGVRATYVKDYRVNDTLTFGVTLLEATTDSGWAKLQEGFGIPVIPKELEVLLYEDSNRVSVKSFPKPAPIYINGDTMEYDIIAISRNKHIITYFEIQNKNQLDMIMQKQLNDWMGIKEKNYEEKKALVLQQTDSHPTSDRLTPNNP